ncbi:hypothetical protein [Streptomyces coeruleofuscus]|uniref:Uncharacterized protein n=1 Tax=Streptomyces coeruleofuscus TaxID=66879 RepID=A0ABN3ISE7_9ACTN
MAAAVAKAARRADASLTGDLVALLDVPEGRRIPELVRHLEASAVDDALDLFALLTRVKLISAAKRATDKDWLAAKPRLARHRPVGGGLRPLQDPGPWRYLPTSSDLPVQHRSPR